MNKRYIRMDIEADKNCYLNRALVTYEENGRTRTEYSFDRDIKYDLENFAAQENIPIDRLIYVKPKVNFKITSFGKDMSHISKLSAGEIPYCTHLLMELMKEKEEQRRQQYQNKLSKFKGVIKLTVCGATIIAIMATTVGCKLQKINALKNQYVAISLYSIPQEMDPHMVGILSDYNDFDFIMSNIAEKNWSELKDTDLSSFFNDLNWINSTNTLNISGRYLNNDRSSKTTYVTYFERYFEGTPNDYYAIKYINDCFNKINENHYSPESIDDAVSKYLDFVIDKNNHQNNHTVWAGDGTYRSIYYDWMSPAAKYLINSQMLEVIRSYDFNGKDYAYKWLTKEQIISRIEEYQRENYNAILRSIEIEERKR